MPSTVNGGALLIAFIEFKSTVSAPVITNPTGWTETIDIGHGGSNLNFIVAWKVADGDEGGTTVDWVTDVNSVCVAQVYHVTAWEGTLANGVDDGSVAALVNANPNPPTLNPGAWSTEDTLWIAATGYGDDDETVDTSSNGYPDDAEGTFTGGTNNTTGGGTNASAGLATARLEKTTNQVNPGTFTLTGSEGWAATTVGVRPGTAGSGTSGNGDVGSDDSTVTGSGWRDEAANGNLGSTAATIAGSGRAAWLGNGDVASGDANLGGEAGAGVTGDIVEWDASTEDVLWSSDSADIMLWTPIPGTIPAQGISKSLGDGNLQSNSTASGHGFQPLGDASGNGDVSAESATIGGDGISKSLADGDLAVGFLNEDDADVTGSGFLGVTIIAALAMQDSQVAGSGTRSGAGAPIETGNEAGRKFAGRGKKRRPRTRKPVFLVDP
jgi:hypothetical protein